MISNLKIIVLNTVLFKKRICGIFYVAILRKGDSIERI